MHVVSHCCKQYGLCCFENRREKICFKIEILRSKEEKGFVQGKTKCHLLACERENKNYQLLCNEYLMYALLRKR